jgi:NADPH-dependent 2,4-dienoyl-CoA reductase/sulfur reductase-like enzyme
MRLAGIELHLGFALDVSHLQQSSEQPAFMLGDGSRITPDLVLAATGRKPNVEDLGLAKMDIVATPFITVDEQMRTSCDRVFAVGDVNGLTLIAPRLLKLELRWTRSWVKIPVFPLDGFRGVSIRIPGQLPSAGTKMKQAGLGLT